MLPRRGRSRHPCGPSRPPAGDAATQHPERLIAYAFAAVIAVGTALLMLPFATARGDGAPFVIALFTSTSAVCVTGLAVVDTGTYWSPFGQVVILLLIQVGGLGIMTLASIGLVLLGPPDRPAPARARAPPTRVRRAPRS